MNVPRRVMVSDQPWPRVMRRLLVRGGDLQKTKTNGARQVPVNDNLPELFRRIRKGKHLKSQYVFTRMWKKPMNSIKIGFKAALERAGG